MAKSSRNKKLKKEDFQKKKLRVGKPGSGVASEEQISLKSVKSRRIELSSQNFGVGSIKAKIQDASLGKDANANVDVDKTQAAAVFQHASERLKHYSEPTRKEALSLLAKTITKSPWLIRARTGDLISWFGRLMCDDSDDVRRQAIPIFSGILDALDAEHIHPFNSLLIALLCAAMTHIRPEIRADSVKFLRLVQDKFPSLVVSDSAKLIRNYFSLLGVRSLADLPRLCLELDDDPMEHGAAPTSSNSTGGKPNNLPTEVMLEKSSSWRKDLKSYSRSALMKSSGNGNGEEATVVEPKLATNQRDSVMRPAQKKKANKMAGTKLNHRREVFRGLALLLELSMEAENLYYYPWRKPFDAKKGAVYMEWPTDNEVTHVPYLEIPPRMLMYAEQGNQPRLGLGMFN